MWKLNKLRPEIPMLVASLFSMFLVACASTDAHNASPSDVRNCFKTNWLASSLEGASAKRYSDFASTCRSASQGDIKPSQARIALFNASQLYHSAGHASTVTAQRTTYFGEAARLGEQALASGFRVGDLSSRLTLLQAAFGSELELGLMPSTEGTCSTQLACLSAGVDGLARHRENTISSALTSNNKSLKGLAADISILEARAISELVTLQGDGSVHLALEKLENVTRQTRRSHPELSDEAQTSHTYIAIRHADSSMRGRSFSDAVEYLKQATQFGQERNANANTQAELQIMLGEALILKTDYKASNGGGSDVYGYCEAANSFQAATRSSENQLRAEARRGVGLAHAKIAKIGGTTCLASRQSALESYRAADRDDPGAKLPRAHYLAFSDLLSDVDPTASLALDQRQGGSSRLDFLIGGTTVTRRPVPPITANTVRSSANVIPAALAPVSTWSIASLNTRARSLMQLARRERSVDRYKEAVAADSNWPLARLELGEFYLQRGQYDLAAAVLSVARGIAETDPVRHGQAYARATYLQGRNELLRHRDGQPSNLTLALSASRRSAGNSVEPVYKYQACIAALVRGSMTVEDIQLCEFSGTRIEDDFFSAFGQIRQMQVARRAMDADYSARQIIDERYRQKQRGYEREADMVEAAFQTLLGRSNRTARVAIPVSQSRFTVEDFARMGLYLGETCQNEYKDAPSISRDPNMLALFEMMKLDSCDAS